MISCFPSARTTTDWSRNYRVEDKFSMHICNARRIFFRFSTAIWYNSKVQGEKDLLTEKPELHSSSPANISWNGNCTINRLSLLAVGHCLIWKHPSHSGCTINRYFPNNSLSEIVCFFFSNKIPLSLKIAQWISGWKRYPKTHYSSFGVPPCTTSSSVSLLLTPLCAPGRAGWPDFQSVWSSDSGQSAH